MWENKIWLILKNDDILNGPKAGPAELVDEPKGLGDKPKGPAGLRNGILSYVSLKSFLYFVIFILNIPRLFSIFCVLTFQT